LPWRASFGWTSGAAPALGADTEMVLKKVLDVLPDRIAALRQSGALG
jgi:crotonobetainyl-CoA:carnitine CoA-transferase CaiB-like acyl-CoA transferase